MGVRGASSVTEYKVPDARFHTSAFCSRCGAKLPRVSPERGIVAVPAGSLDTDPGMRAQGPHLRCGQGAVVRHHGGAAAVRRDAAGIGNTVPWSSARIRRIRRTGPSDGKSRSRSRARRR